MDASQRQRAGDRVFEILDRLIDRHGVAMSKADLGRMLAAQRKQESPSWKVPNDPSKTVQGWYSVGSRKMPSVEWREALFAVAKKELDLAAAIEMESALQEYWAHDKAARRRRGRDEADLRASGGRVTAAWELKLHGVIELQDGEVPTVASRMGDDELPVGAGDKWRLRSSVTGDALPPYVPRTIDEELRTRMRDQSMFPIAPVVLLVGPPKAGKTRTIVEALRRSESGFRHLHFHELLPPIGRDTLTEYHAAIERALAAHAESATKAVLFIDDLHRHLDTRPMTADGSGATRAGSSIRALLVAISRLQIPVVATCHPWILEREPGSLGISHDDQNWLRRHAVLMQADLDRDELSDAIEILVGAGIDAAIVGDTNRVRRLGALLGDVDVLRASIAESEREASADHQNKEAASRAAVISGLVDSLLFHDEPIDPEQLLIYARNYVNLGTAAPRLFDAALEWVTSDSRPSPHGNPIAPYDAPTNTLQLLDALHADLIASHKSEVPVDQITSEMAFSAGEKTSHVGSLAVARDWWWRATLGGHLGAHYSLAQSYLVENRLDDPEDPMGAHAAGWYRRLLALDPTVTSAILGLGICRLFQGQYDDPADPMGDHAAGWYSRALATDPTNANIMFNFGMLRRNQGLLDDQAEPYGDHAAGWYRRALEADPIDSGPMLEIAVLRRNQGRLDDPSEPLGDHAAGWWRRALEIDPSDEEALEGLKSGYPESLRGIEPSPAVADRQTKDRAAKMLRALDANPGDTSAMIEMGNIRRGEGLLDDPADPRGDHAVGWNRRALDLDPSNTSALHNLGVVRMDQDVVDDPNDSMGDHAAGWFRRTLEVEPESVLAMYNFGILRLREGHFDDPSDPKGDHAAGWFRRALEVKPNFSDAMYMFGLVRNFEGCIDDPNDPTGDHAAGWFRRAAELGHVHAISLLEADPTEGGS